RTEQGNRSGRDRKAVLQSLKMTADQVRKWAEDPKAAKEDRSATLYQEGYVEVVSHDSSDRARYTVRDEAGIRSNRERKSVLATREMTADQVKAWAGAKEGEAEGRAVEPLPKIQAQETISTARGSVFSRGSKSASGVLKLSDEKIREWVADPKGAKEG